jgi:hypothetical protein
MRSPTVRGSLAATLALLIVLLALAPSASALDRAKEPVSDGQYLQSTPEPPALSADERIRLAFLGFEPGVADVSSLFPGRLVDQDFADWPSMRYLGDSAFIAGKTFTVQEVLLVPGEANPVIYEPATGNKRAAPGGLRTNLVDFSKNTGVFIPPNSTLVMVRVEVEPEAVEHPSGVTGCRTSNEPIYDDVLRVSYSRHGESRVLLTSSDEAFGEFASPTHYCLTSGWHYFHIGTLNVDLEKVWFEIVDGETDMAVAIWTLLPTPAE